MRVLALAILVAISASALVAQSKPDFTGKWTLSSGDRGMWGAEFSATQNDKTLTVIRTVQRGPLSYVYNFDGSPSHFAAPIGGQQQVDQVSTAKWDGSKLVVTTKYRTQGFDQQTVQTWSLDAAGNLTVGLAITKNGQPDGTGESVYKKSQAEASATTSELEGIWIVQSAENNGKPLKLSGSTYVANSSTGFQPEMIPDERRITIKGNAAVFKGFVLNTNREPLEEPYTCEVDAKATPKAVTFQTESKVILGVYELSGDTLRLALGKTATGERLTKVSSDTNVMYVLKRLK